MDQIHCDCSSSEKIIKKPSLVGASTARYILAASLILKFPLLISFFFTNKWHCTPVSLFWLGSIHSFSPVTVHVPFLVCFSNLLGDVCVWLLSGTSILPGLGDVSHSFSAAHNSCPRIHGITTVLSAWVTLGKTLSLGSDGLEVQILAPSQTCPPGFWTHFQLTSACFLINKMSLESTKRGFAWILGIMPCWRSVTTAFFIFVVV